MGGSGGETNSGGVSAQEVKSIVSSALNDLMVCVYVSVCVCVCVCVNGYGWMDGWMHGILSRASATMAPAAAHGKPRCWVCEGVCCVKVYDIISGPGVGCVKVYVV